MTGLTELFKVTKWLDRRKMPYMIKGEILVLDSILHSCCLRLKGELDDSELTLGGELDNVLWRLDSLGIDYIFEKKTEPTTPRYEWRIRNQHLHNTTVHTRLLYWHKNSGGELFPALISRLERGEGWNKRILEFLKEKPNKLVFSKYYMRGLAIQAGLLTLEEE